MDSLDKMIQSTDPLLFKLDPKQIGQEFLQEQTLFLPEKQLDLCGFAVTTVKDSSDKMILLQDHLRFKLGLEPLGLDIAQGIFLCYYLNKCKHYLTHTT